MEQTPLRARCAREKQSNRGGAATRFADGASATPPSRGRVWSRIQFKPESSVAVALPSVSADRIFPKNRPRARKAVMFPNPAFHASTSAVTDTCATPSPSKKQKRFYKTRSPVVVARQTPHKFLVKSPPSALGPSSGSTEVPCLPDPPPPPVKVQASLAKTPGCSFSPSRLARRLVPPIKARLSLNRTGTTASVSAVA